MDEELYKEIYNKVLNNGNIQTESKENTKLKKEYYTEKIRKITKIIESN